MDSDPFYFQCQKVSENRWIGKDEAEFVVDMSHQLGVGSQGGVYEGVYYHQSVACKTAHAFQNPKLYGDFFSQQVKETQREIDTFRNLNHPRICKLIAVGQDKDKTPVWVLSERHECSLDSFIKPDNPLDPQKVLAYSLDVLSALACMHAKQMIHRDLKPANILLADGRVKVTDFGLSRVLTSSAMTSIGTPSHLAPEVVSGTYDASVDVYAFGVTVTEMGLGEHASAYHQERVDAVLQLCKPGTIYEKLGDILPRCLSKDPTQRPTVKQLIDKFEAVSKEMQSRGDVPPPYATDDTLPTSQSSKSDAKKSSQSKLSPSDSEVLSPSGSNLKLSPSEAKPVQSLSDSKGSDPKQSESSRSGCAPENSANIYAVGYWTSIYAFDHVRQNWKELKAMPWSRDWPAIAMQAPYLYVCGGQNYGVVNTVFRYDTKENDWSSLPNMLCSRTAASAVVMNDSLYVCGGRSSMIGDSINLAEYYDGQEWRYIGCLKQARRNSALIQWQNRLYLFAGLGEKDDLQSYEVFDPKTNSWSLGEKPTARVRGRCRACVNVAEQVVYVYDQNGSLDEFDLQKKTWQHLGQSPSAHLMRKYPLGLGIVYVSPEEEAAVLGQQQEKNKEHSKGTLYMMFLGNRMESYSVATQKWKTFPDKLPQKFAQLAKQDLH